MGADKKENKMGYITAERIRNEKTAKAIKAWEKAGKPDSTTAQEAFTSARKAIEADWNRIVYGNWKKSNKADTQARIRYFTANLVWIGALHAEGKSILHLT